jgi:alanine-glyoxylate transaminase/serine-glyoxylate transaminase/serine-pyruvate transaminase
MVYALREALHIAHEEGLEARWARHRASAELLWNGLEEMGLQPFVPLECRAPTLTTVAVPDGIDDAAVRRRLLQEYSIEIAGGFGPLKGKIFRVGLMGAGSMPRTVLTFLAAFGAALRAEGYRPKRRAA